MWGRRTTTDDKKATPVATATTATSGARLLTNPDDLLRRADWDRLTAEDRATQLRIYQGQEVPRFGDVATESGLGPDTGLQDWIALVVSVCLQPQAAGVIRSWLDDGAPDAHLYVGGGPGQGRTSLVASLARQAMARRSAPPEYCYVPDAKTLDKPIVLAVPKGTGADFTGALSTALRAIADKWDGGDDDGDSNTDNIGNGSSASVPGAPTSTARLQLIADQFAPVVDAAPDAARGYLDSLQATLEQRSGGDLPFSSDDVPVAHVSPVPDDLLGTPGGQGAPVVVVSLGQNDLTDVLLRANGGVLVLQAPDVLDSSTWSTLSDALKMRSLVLKQGWPAIPLTVRTVLIGSGGAYNALASNTEDFTRLFRYEVWCNWDVAWNRDAEATYAMLADGVSKRHGLPPFDPSGVARLVEEGGRRVDGLNRTRLSTNLLLLHDLALEAGRLARARGSAATTGEHVDGALQLRRTLQAGGAERVREAILSGQEMTPTSGSAIGQINGLGIYEAHPDEASFAVPMRISAIVSAGQQESLIDIEKEADQADSDHVRGLMTMEGYLANVYGQSRPISVAARIRFEQQHGATGGDSASAAELFALLSALAQVPIRSSLAVTGAVGQYGEVQPIGGVNTKIEGFWALCRARWAQGERPDGGYGVIIPAVNARDLMLRPDIAASILNEGWFHIWTIANVDEGIPLLMNLPAQEVHNRVDRRLQQFYDLAQRNRQR